MSKKIRYRFSRIYPRPNFATGFGSVMNIHGNYYEFKRFGSATEADEHAIASDWYTVGNALYNSMDATRKELPQWKKETPKKESW